MTTEAIAVVNTEGTLIDAVIAALTDAFLKGKKVFGRVVASTSAQHIEQTMFRKKTPFAAVLATMGTETKGVPTERHITLDLTVYVGKQCPAKLDETAKTKEKFRLANLVKNAIEADTTITSTATGIPDEDNFHPKGPRWGEMSDVETENAKPPWVAFTLPFTLGFPILTLTSH